MLVTEEQAKTIVCPLTLNRAGAFEMCRGTGCMGFRWGESVRLGKRYAETARSSLLEEPPRPRQLPATWVWVPFVDGKDYAHWAEPENEATARRRGFCGLAPIADCAP